MKIPRIEERSQRAAPPFPRLKAVLVAQREAGPRFPPAIGLDNSNRALPLTASQIQASALRDFTLTDSAMLLRLEGVSQPVRIKLGAPIVDLHGEFEGWRAYRASSSYIMIHKSRQMMDLSWN